MPESTPPLHSIPGFEILPQSVLQELQAAASPRNFAAGQIIYLQDDPAVYVYILLKGWVKASRMTRTGREQGMMFLRPVNLFGLISAVTQKPYPATTTALEAVETLVLSAVVFSEIVQKHPNLAWGVIHNLCQRNLHFIDLVEDLALHTVESRLASSLLRNAVFTPTEVFVSRQTWTTFDEMAIRLGTVRDVLSRALKTLEGEKLIRVNRQKITILDPEALLKRGEMPDSF